MVNADQADGILNKKELWHQPSAVIQKVWFSPSLLIAELVLWLWKVVPRNMTYCAFDSLEISTCVRVPFYVTPPHSQPFNMMHICTSTATKPPPPTLSPHPSLYSHIRKTHKQAHKKADAFTSLYPCVRTLAQTPQICVRLVKKQHTCRQIHKHGHTYVLTGDLFPFI